MMWFVLKVWHKGPKNFQIRPADEKNAHPWSKAVFPNIFGSRHPQLVLYIFCVIPVWFIRYKDQGKNVDECAGLYHYIFIYKFLYITERRNRSSSVQITHYILQRKQIGGTSYSSKLILLYCSKLV